MVDDSKVMIATLSSALEEKGYKVTFSLNGKDAIDWISNHKPSLIILDVEMPVMDGYETIKLLKADKETANIPVIFHTSLTKPEAIERLFNLGASDYITKPFIPVELFARIEKEINNIALQNKLQEKMSRLAEILAIDPLTKTSNKMHMTSIINAKLQKLANENRGVFSLMYIDIDNFNNFAKTHGIPESEIALKKCSMVFKRCIRDKDILSRWEADIFIILFPQIVNENLNKIATTIKENLEKVPFASHSNLSATISMVEVSESDTLNNILATLKIQNSKAKQQRKGSIIIADGRLLM
ncbi:MAG: response regulator [Sulfurimonas sp.]